MGFAKPIEQYLIGNLLTKIQGFMYLKDIIRGRDFMKKKSILPLVTVTMLATALLGGCTNKTDSTTSFSDYEVTQP